MKTKPAQNGTIKMTYLWLDGYDTPNIRSKCKYLNEADFKDGDQIPQWTFDGSSTKQAESDNSDCVLHPVRAYPDPFNKHHPKAILVLCEVRDSENEPHPTNYRSKLIETLGEDKNEYWFGIEQEYVVVDPFERKPAGWHKDFEPSPQGRYYCGVGGDVTRFRQLSEMHATACRFCNIPLTGTNAEVMLSQWEYQTGPSAALNAADDLWISRYIMETLAEEMGVAISLDPKPVEGDWNGSGAHINFSSKEMRETGGEELFSTIVGELKDNHKEHISDYGLGNENRLTGDHETQHIDSFSFGEADRGASIRVPYATSKGSVGHLEDRRPASNIDPYRALNRMVSTLNKAHSLIKA
jgi:glutamine synthetase